MEALITANKRAKVLIVEDEVEIRLMLAEVLATRGLEPIVAESSEVAMQTFHRTEPDLVILDLMMPVVSGLDILQQVRKTHTTPVIMLTARDALDDRVHGLEAGADDYIVKPFAVRELIARVDALLRRSRMTPAVPAPGDRTIMDFPGLRIDVAARQVKVDDRPVELTAMEFDLLAFVAARPGRVFTRGELLDAVWKSSSDFQTSATVTEHMRRLRQKIERDPAHPKWLETVRGVGYRFERRHARRDDRLPT